MFRRILILASPCACASTLVAQDLEHIQIHGFDDSGLSVQLQQQLLVR